MAIRISKNVRIILYVLLGILVLGGSGYLVWRINQPDTVAPEDSDASECPVGCNFYSNTRAWVCPDGDISKSYPSDLNGCYRLIGALRTEGGPEEGCFQLCTTTPPPPTDPSECKYIANIGDTGPAGSSCDASNCQGGTCSIGDINYTFKCGTRCYDATCGAAACTQTAITTYTLRYSAGTGGSITGNSSQTVNKGANGTAVTAVANTGYTFTKWSDDKTTNPRTDTNVQGNINVTAQFEESAVITNTCQGATWIEQPEGTYNHCTSISARAENRDVDGIDTNSIVVKLNGEAKNKCSGIPGEVCYQTNVVDGKTRILMNLNNNYCLDAGSYTLSFEWKDGLGNAGCNLSTSFSIAPQGEIVVEKGGDTVPQTGLLDTVLGRVSLGFGFIFLGGLVSQYSKLNYMYESIQQKGKFRREISKEKRMSRERDKFERRVR